MPGTPRTIQLLIVLLPLCTLPSPKTTTAAILAQAPDLRQINISPDSQWVTFGDVGESVTDDRLKALRLDQPATIIDFGQASVSRRGGRGSPPTYQPPQISGDSQRIVYRHWTGEQWQLVSQSIDGEGDPLALSAGLDGQVSSDQWALAEGGALAVWRQGTEETATLHAIPIPEPATLTLSIAAATALLRSRRRPHPPSN